MDKEAEDAFERCLRLSDEGSTAVALHHAFAYGGTRAVLQWRLTDLKGQLRKRYVSPYESAVLYDRLGDKQQALTSLEEAVRQHSPLLFDLQEDTSFDLLHADPHYRAIVGKTGLPPAYKLCSLSSALSTRSPLVRVGSYRKKTNDSPTDVRALKNTLAKDF